MTTVLTQRTLLSVSSGEDVGLLNYCLRLLLHFCLTVHLHTKQMHLNSFHMTPQVSIYDLNATFCLTKEMFFKWTHISVVVKNFL